jgi:DNA-binding response OmpR family regulator
MVVDADILVRMVIAAYLRECGYKVIEGMAGSDVFAVLNAGGGVDIVLADSQLPDMDGFTLAKKVRETYPNVDVILAGTVKRTAEKAGELCEDGPLDRPYHPQEVLRRINLLRERRQAQK